MTNDKDSAVHGCEEQTLAEQLIEAVDDTDWELSAFVRENADAILNALRQPTQSDAVLDGDAQTILYLLGVRHGREDERAKIAAEASQPTQSDALREENERLRALLARTVNLAEVYAEGTGTNFKEAMAEARAALQEQSK